MEKRIAIPVDSNGILDAHFGHCKFFAVLDINENKITNTEKLTPPPHEPGVLPRWLAEQGVTDVLAGGMGQKAVQIFNHHQVNVFVGAPQLPAEEIVKGFLDNSLDFRANYCDH